MFHPKGGSPQDEAYRYALRHILNLALTPKRPYVPGVTKLVLVRVVWSHTIFGFFETFCEDASHPKLCVSINFIIFGPTDQKLMVFEVFWKGLARAGMCWSQSTRVDYLHEKWRAWEKKIQKKGQSTPVRVHVPAAGRRLLVAGRGSTPGQVQTVLFFLNLFYFFEFIYWKFGEWARAFGRMDVQHLHFLKLAPYTWKC
jgi:hypothetical protein